MPAIEITGEAAPATEAERAAWTALAGENPRLYDGPALMFAGWDAARRVIRARRGSFLRLAVRDRIGLCVQQVGVTVVVRRGDAVLFGRRAMETRVYSGLWELGPSGGIDPPGADDAVAMGGDGALALYAARRELAEEAGLEPALARWVPRAVVDDPIGGSFEAVIEAHVGEDAQASAANWEYDEVAWIPISEIGAFFLAYSGEVIPPTVAIAQAFGWATES